MNYLYIMGGSGIGMIAAAIIDERDDVSIGGFVNDAVPKGSRIGKYKKISVVAVTEEIPQLLETENTYLFYGFVGMKRQDEAYWSFKNLNIPIEKFMSVTAAAAVIPQDYCSVGKGVLFAPYSQLSPDTTIGDHCRLLGNCFVGHDTVIDECVSLATNSVIGANVHIERGVHVGSNATVREKVSIGEFSLVGMGAVVVKDVPPRSIVIGNPARILKTI